MNTYGLTLAACEGLIWAVRQEPTLWNRSYEDNSPRRGDGRCCVLGAWKRYELGVFGSYSVTPADRFELDWFGEVARRMEQDMFSPFRKPSPGLRWLVLGKLRLIHRHLRDEAEHREEVCAWAPAVVEAPSQKEVAPCGS